MPGNGAFQEDIHGQHNAALDKGHFAPGRGADSDISAVVGIGALADVILDFFHQGGAHGHHWTGQHNDLGTDGVDDVAQGNTHICSGFLHHLPAHRLSPVAQQEDLLQRQGIRILRQFTAGMELPQLLDAADDGKS